MYGLRQLFSGTGATGSTAPVNATTPSHNTRGSKRSATDEHLALYDSSQTQIREMQVKLDSQKKKRQLLEEEVSSGQAHIAELTAILKSAVRSNSVSGQAGPQSPRSATLSHEGSSGEVGPRLRSKELQALTQRLQLSVADARSDLERHSSLRSADLKAEFSGSSRRAGQVLASPDTAPNSPSGRRIQAIHGLTNTGEGPGYSSGASTPNSDSQRRRPPGQSHMPAKPMIDSPRAKRPSFSSAAGQQRQAAWQ